MNHKSTIISSGLLACVALTAWGVDGLPFMSYKAAKPSRVAFPQKPDSVETGNIEFDRSKLLSARRAADYFHRYETADWTTMQADTAGMVRFKAPAGNEGVLQVLTTRIRPERFVKGRLVADATSMLEVFVNGESKIRKNTADSIATPAETALELQPEVTADIEVHLLASGSDKGAPEFSLRFIPDSGFKDVAVDMGHATTRRFSIQTTTLGQRLNSTSISPDGKYMLLYYSETYGEGDSRSWTVLQETATMRYISTSIPSNAIWMPTGSTLCFSERSASANNIYTMSLPSLKRDLLAANAPVTSSEIYWSPDAKWFAYYCNEEGKKETGVMKRISEPDDRMPGNRDRAYLMKYDVASGLAQPLTFGGPSTYISSIAPDSKSLLYISNRQTPGEYPFYNMSLIRLDVNTLATDTICSGGSSMTGAIFSPDGKRVLVTAGPNAFDGIGLNAGNHELGNDFDIQLYMLDIASRKVTPLTRDFDPSVQGTPVWNRADGMIYFTAEEGFAANLFRLNPSDGKISRINTKVDYTRNFSIGRGESRWLAYTGQSYDYIGRGYLLDLRNNRSVLIDDPMGAEISGLDLGKTESWKFTAADGTVVDGTVTLPPNFDPSKKYPLIVYYYGGTSPSNYGMGHPYTPQLFASRDYVVYVLNPSGTTGYGQEYSARHVNAWGDWTADEIIQGVKEFCKAHPFVDDKKIGCLGASYGGFMTQLLQTRTDLFAAAVSHAGISNVTSYWGEGYWGYSYNSVAAAKSYPWNNPELFTKHGSLFNADKIHTPLLLLHGTRDTNVPIGESIQLFNALKILGRTCEFITVEDQDHIITDYNKRQLWHATIMAWFAKYLQDDSRWWDSMYGK